MSPPVLPSYITGALKALGSGLSQPKEFATLTFAANDHGQYWTHGHSGIVQFEFLVDTGAAFVVLRSSEANRAGIFSSPLDYTRPVATANGTAYAAAATLAWLGIGGIVRPQVAICILPDASLPMNVLGMSFLSRLNHLEMRGGTMTMTG